VAHHYPKDSSGRALIEQTVEAFIASLRDAPFDQRKDALDWLANIPNGHAAATFKAAIDGILRPDVEAEREKRAEDSARNREKRDQILDRMLDKRKGQE
jgi:hypothetical protein